MAPAYSTFNVKLAFRDNGQIYPTNEAIPFNIGLLGTYHGIIGNNHYLKDGHSLISKYYNKTYLNGKISETTFDEEGVEIDQDGKGIVVSCDFEIGWWENCQRAKVLSFQTQSNERNQLMEKMKI